MQLAHNVLSGDSRKVVDLATAQDGGNNLMLLGGGEDEDGVSRGLLESLQEGIERCSRQHVHLVDDIHAIFAYWGRDAHLVDEVAHIIHRVV